MTEWCALNGISLDHEYARAGETRSRGKVAPEVLCLLSGTWPVRHRGVSVLAYAISERLERAERSGAGAPEREKTPVNFP